MEGVHPIWEAESHIESDQGHRRVVVPINIGAIQTTYSETITPNDLPRYGASVSLNFIIYEEYKDKAPIAYIISYQPTKDWLDSHSELRFYPENLLPNGFSGDIYILGMNYKPIERYVCDNGEIKKLYSNSNKESQKETARALVCAQTLKTKKGYHFMDMVYDEELKRLIHRYTLVRPSRAWEHGCVLVDEDISIDELAMMGYDLDKQLRLNQFIIVEHNGRYYRVRNPDAKAGGGSGSTTDNKPNNGPRGGGGGVDSTKDRKEIRIELDNKAIKRVINPNIQIIATHEEQERIVKEFETVYEDELGKTLIDELHEAKYTIDTIIVKNEEEGGAASLSNLGALKFLNSDEIKAKHILHELGHAYQRVTRKAGRRPWKNLLGMVEFENHFILDVYRYKTRGRDGEQDWAVMARYGESPDVLEQYFDWLSSITNGGTEWPDFDSLAPETKEKFYEFSTRFGEDYTFYSHLTFGSKTYQPISSRILFKKLREKNKKQ